MPRLCILPVAILRDSRLSGQDLRAALALSNFADQGGGGIYASNTTLAKVAWMHERPFRRSLSHLIDCGWVSRTLRKRKTSLLSLNMQFVPPPEFDRQIGCGEADATGHAEAVDGPNESASDASGPRWSGPIRSVNADLLGPSIGPDWSASRTDLVPVSSELSAPVSPPVSHADGTSDASSTLRPTFQASYEAQELELLPSIGVPTAAPTRRTTGQRELAPGARSRPARPAPQFPHFTAAHKAQLIGVWTKHLCPIIGSEIGRFTKAFGRWFLLPESERDPAQPTDAEVVQALEEMLVAKKHSDGGDKLAVFEYAAERIGLIVQVLRETKDNVERADKIDRRLGLRPRVTFARERR